MNDWKTNISARNEAGELLVRGQALNELIKQRSFVDVIFFLLRGDFSNEAERAMMDAMLVAVCEHGLETPSTRSARTSISSGNALNTALAAGLLGMGARHGCAVTAAMEYFESDEDPIELVQRLRAEGKRLPGYGHKVYKVEDPRARILFKKAEKLGLAGAFVRRARVLESAIHEVNNKVLPLNVDGALAALLLEMRFPKESGNGVFMIGRIPGLIAHCLEEMNERTYRR